MGRIQTGVDKLVALLHEKKKVTIEDAAKELGVSKMILQKWADFLQEEGLLEIKYSLSKTYLVDKVLTKREFSDKQNQFEDQRETFIKRVDSSISQLQSESVNFETFKKDFLSLKDQLGVDLEAIQKELNELKSYDTLKARVTEDLQKQRMQFDSKMQETQTLLKRQYNQYQDVIHAMAAQEEKLAEHKQKVHVLLSSEESVGKKLDEYTKLLSKLRQNVTSETEELGVDEETLEKLRQQAIKFRQGLQDLHENNLKPLEALRIKHEQTVKKLESDILTKAATIEAAIKKPQAQKQVMSKKLEEFFKRKEQIEKLLDTIEDDKTSLLAELKSLQVRAEAYRLGQTSVRMEELESKLSTIEARKSGLRNHISQFLKLLH